jgi:RNA polymerase sigma factor (sigma-70 family)
MTIENNFNSLRNQKNEKLIYDEYHKRLYYTSLRILNNSMDAEEVMHDTLLTYFRKGIDFQTIKERDSWLFRVCINLSIDRLRKYKSENLLLNSRELNVEEIDEEAVDNFQFKGITVEEVKKALNNLAAGYRLILSLHLFEGYDYKEISQIMHLKEVSVRSQYIRGKAKLIDEINAKRNN